MVLIASFIIFEIFLFTAPRSAYAGVKTSAVRRFTTQDDARDWSGARYCGERLEEENRKQEKLGACAGGEQTIGHLDGGAWRAVAGRLLGGIACCCAAPLGPGLLHSSLFAAAGRGTWTKGFTRSPVGWGRGRGERKKDSLLSPPFRVVCEMR